MVIMENFESDRLSICNSCDYNIDQTCILCGCDVVNKVKQREESCPAFPKKWAAYTEPEIKKVHSPPIFTGANGLVSSNRPPCETCTKRR